MSIILLLFKEGKVFLFCNIGILFCYFNGIELFFMCFLKIFL